MAGRAGRQQQAGGSRGGAGDKLITKLTSQSQNNYRQMQSFVNGKRASGFPV
jgi:hypothetical protein